MRLNQKRIFDAGVSKSYEKGLTIDTHQNGSETYFIQEPKSVVNTTGTYAISESHVITTTNGIFNNSPVYHFSGIQGNTNK
jgi:hypothetical protein